ncbi:MAG: response regulator, partial [Angelakisella sp.]
MKVLIADDDQFVRQCLHALIPWDEIGFDQIIEASNGGQAYELAMQHCPDLVITDIKMPVITGLEVAQRISHSMVDTYIIVLSAYNDFEYARAAISCGVEDYVLKPFTKDRIVQLSERIRQIAANIDKKNSYRKLMLDRNRMETSIQHALETSNSQAVALFFEEELPGLGLLLPDLKDFCLQLQDILFQYMLKKHYPPQEVEQYRAEALAVAEAQKYADEFISGSYQLWLRYIDFMSEKNDTSYAYARQMEEYVLANYGDEELSVSKLATVLHISAVYAGALFKQQYSVSLTAFIQQVRIQKAIKLLDDCGIPIADAGKQVGYSNRD